MITPGTDNYTQSRPPAPDAVYQGSAPGIWRTLATQSGLFGKRGPATEGI
jgi:hypothetical protein